MECLAALTSVVLDGTESSDPDGDPLTYEWVVPSGSGAFLDAPTSPTPTGHFPLGPALVTLTVADGSGEVDFDDVLITVQDTTPPVLVCTTDLIALWPANHQMEEVVITVEVSDAATSPQNLNLVCEITSSEIDDGSGDGGHAGDVDGQNGYAAPVLIPLIFDGTNYQALVELRAERDGTDKGRDYSIVCEVTDISCNTATASCVVSCVTRQTEELIGNFNLRERIPSVLFLPTL